VDSNLDLIASHPYRPGKFAKLDVDMVSRMEEELHREEFAKAAHERVSREANPRERQGGGAATGTAADGGGGALTAGLLGLSTGSTSPAIAAPAPASASADCEIS